MQWEDIVHFDETNAQQVEALQEHCLKRGRVVYALQKKHGWSLSNSAETAELFGATMTIDDRFPFEQFHLEVPGGNDYWWNLVQQMASWWLQGYHEARSKEQAEGGKTMSDSDWRASLALNQVESYMRRQVGEIDISVTLDVQEIANEAATHFQAFDNGKTPPEFVTAAQNVIRYYTGD